MLVGVESFVSATCGRQEAAVFAGGEQNAERTVGEAGEKVSAGWEVCNYNMYATSHSHDPRFTTAENQRG